MKAKNFKYLFVVILSALFLTVVLSNEAQATLIPGSLTAANRIRITEILGFGMSSTASYSPRPLGDHRGTQIFLSQDYFSSTTLTNMGNGQSSAGNQQISTLGMGQGLYYDIDTFLYFSPMPQRELMTNYGGLIRGKIFRDPSAQIQLSAALTAAGSNFENKAFFTNTGLDVLMSFLGEKIDLTVGLGQGRCIGQFIGGASGVTDSGNFESHDLSASHLLISGDYNYKNYNFVLTWDRYVESKTNFKLGYRF